MVVDSPLRGSWPLKTLPLPFSMKICYIIPYEKKMFDENRLGNNFPLSIYLQIHFLFNINVVNIVTIQHSKQYVQQ